MGEGKKRDILGPSLPSLPSLPPPPPGDARLERCRAFLPVSGVLQTVQRAEFWGAILAMQAYWPCHLGIDNLNVMLFVALVVYLMLIVWLSLFLWSRMGTWLLLSNF